MWILFHVLSPGRGNKLEANTLKVQLAANVSLSLAEQVTYPSTAPNNSTERRQGTGTGLPVLLLVKVAYSPGLSVRAQFSVNKLASRLLSVQSPQAGVFEPCEANSYRANGPELVEDADGQVTQKPPDFMGGYQGPQPNPLSEATRLTPSTRGNPLLGQCARAQ